MLRKRKGSPRKARQTQPQGDQTTINNKEKDLWQKKKNREGFVRGCKESMLDSYLLVWEE